MKNDINWLRVYLYSMLGMSVAALAFLWQNRDAMFAKFPALAGVLPVYLAAGLGLVAALVGLIFWRRWAFWLCLAASMVAFCAETWAGFAMLKTLWIPLSLLLLVVLARPYLHRFR